ncbi:MAG TPA: PEGA domain-containing protein [Terriglobales bacterium]
MREALCIVAILVASVPGISAQTSSISPPSSKQQPAESQSSDRNWHLRLGTVTAGYFQGPGLYPYYYPYYLAAPWYPFWGWYYPAYVPNFTYSSGKGEVKLAAPTKDAKVFVDGAYAGTADHLKNIWLDPGAYDLAVATPGAETFQQRIYVLSGKTLKITASADPNTLQKEQP